MAKSQKSGFSYNVNSKTGEIVYKEWGDLSPALRKQADGWKEFAEEQNKLMPVRVARGLWIRIPYPEQREAAVLNPSPGIPRMTEKSRLQFYAFVRKVGERYGLDDQGFEVEKAAKGLGLSAKVLNAVLTGYAKPEKKHLMAVAKHMSLEPAEVLKRGAEMLGDGLD